MDLDADAYDAEIDSPEFKHGLDIGVSIGHHEAQTEAQAAFDVGEIELWLDYHRPKSLDDWDRWKVEHGTHEEFKKRWIK